MTADHDWMPTITELTEKLFDDNLSVEERGTLHRLLSQGPQQRRYYLAYANVLITLERKGRLPPSPATLSFGNAVGNSAPLTPVGWDVPTGSDRHAEGPLPPNPTTFSFLGNALHGAVDYCSSGWPMAYLVSTVVCTIGILILASIPVHHYVQFARETDSGSSSTTSLPSSLSPLPSSLVGQITGMVDCKYEVKGLGIRDWGLGKDRKDTNRKSEIRNRKYLVAIGDTIALAAGLMEITYDTGAKVILQGPCTYQVESEVGGYLSVGKLTARVEKGPRSKTQGPISAASSPQPLAPSPSSVPSPLSPLHSPLSTLPSPLFTIKTPTATVTDLGTEFGVEVRPGQEESVVVLQGQVRVATHSGSSKAGQVQTLLAGQTARIDTSLATFVVGPMAEQDCGVAFVRKLPTPRLPAGLERGLVAYWSFDDAANLGANATGGGDLASMGAASQETAGLLGAALRLHQDASDDTLLFNTGQGVPKGVPTGDASYSISAWYQLDAMQPEGNFDIIGWGEPIFGRTNAFFLYGESAGRCMVRNYWWDNDNAGFVDRAAAVGGWHHVVATYNRRGRMQYLYLDTVRIALRAVEQRPDFAAANFSIGRRFMAVEYAPKRVGGLLDEIGLWNRELSEPEISKLYNTGKGFNPLSSRAPATETGATQAASQREKGGETTSRGS